jgi:hypothetical protein
MTDSLFTERIKMRKIVITRRLAWSAARLFTIKAIESRAEEKQFADNSSVCVRSSFHEWRTII